MIKIFVDTDVILDLFFKREPHLENARKIFRLAGSGDIELFSSVTSFTNSYYILSKIIPNTKAKEKLIFLDKRITILETRQDIVKQALFSRFADFEDAVQHYTAVYHKVELLLTRNLKDYKSAVIPVKSPEEFLMQSNFKI